jgi:hypothetical protein
MLLKDETSVFADVVLDRLLWCWGPVAAVNGRRVLKLAEALTGSIMPIELVSPLLPTTGRSSFILIVRVGSVLFFLLVPEITPAL